VWVTAVCLREEALKNRPNCRSKSWLERGFNESLLKLELNACGAITSVVSGGLINPIDVGKERLIVDNESPPDYSFNLGSF
jgi:hypothetical protein